MQELSRVEAGYQTSRSKKNGVNMLAMVNDPLNSAGEPLCHCHTVIKDEITLSRGLQTLATHESRKHASDAIELNLIETRIHSDEQRAIHHCVGVG